MSTGGRVKKLEAATGGRGRCSCPDALAVCYEDEPSPAPTCETCGGERTILRVIYERERGRAP